MVTIREISSFADPTTGFTNFSNDQIKSHISSVLDDDVKQVCDIFVEGSNRYTVSGRKIGIYPKDPRSCSYIDSGKKLYSIYSDVIISNQCFTNGFERILRVDEDSGKIGRFLLKSERLEGLDNGSNKTDAREAFYGVFCKRIGITVYVRDDLSSLPEVEIGDMMSTVITITNIKKVITLIGLGKSIVDLFPEIRPFA